MAEKVEVFFEGHDKLTGIAKGINLALKGVGIAAGLAFAGVSALLIASTRDAMEAEKTFADLNAVIASTGGAAGVTANAANELADSLMKVTKFSDEEIRTGEAMLLTFTQIGKEVFPMATEAMLNMSEKFGTDASQAAVQLGKALNDPIRGMTALRRVGVAFTKDQEKQIKTLQESGDIIGAQKIILKELETEFGGAARAAGETFAGRLKILDNSFGELRESIGFAVIPILQKMVDGLISFMPYFETASETVVGFIEAFAETDAMKGFMNLLSGLGKLFANVMEAFREPGNPILTIFEDGSSYLQSFLELLGMSEDSAGGLARTIITGFKQAEQVFTKLGDGIRTVWASLMNILMDPVVVDAVRKAFSALFEGVSKIVTTILPKLWATFSQIFTAVRTWLDANGPLIISFIQLVMANVVKITGIIVQVVIGAWNIIQPIVVGIVNVVLGFIKLFMQVATQDWGGAWETVKQILSDAAYAIGDAIMALLETIAGLLGTSLAQFQAQWSANWEAFKLMLLLAWQAMVYTVSNYLQTLWNNIRAKFESIVSTVRGIVSGFIDIGASIVEGLITGIENAWDGFVEWLTGLVGNLIDAILAMFGVTRSPSELFMDVGTDLMKGLAIGIKRSVSLPLEALRDIAPTITIAPQVGAQMSMVPVSAQVSAAGNGEVHHHSYYGPVTFQISPQSEFGAELLRGLK